MPEVLSTLFSKLEARWKSQIGFFYAIISQISFLIGHSLVQKSSKHLKSIQILYFIGIQVCSFNYIAMTFDKSSAVCSKSSRTNRMQFTIAFLGFLGACFILSGLPMMPLSEAIVIQMTTPIFTGLLAISFLNEKYDKTLVLTTIFSFIGVILISKPAVIFGENNSAQSFPFRTIGIFITLIGSFVNATTQIAVKKLGAVSSANTTAFYFGVGLALGGPVLQFFQGVNSLEFGDLIWLFLLGISRYISHIFLNKGYALANANKVSLMGYVQVPLAYIIDIFLVGIAVDFYSVLGSACVFSCLFILLLKSK